MTRQEYNIVVQQLSNPLYGFSLKFLRNEEDAQDIVQDVFEKLWINRKKVEFLKAKAWMYTTAYNGMINLITKKQRVQLPGSDQLPEKSHKAYNHFESKEVVCPIKPFTNCV